MSDPIPKQAVAGPSGNRLAPSGASAPAAAARAGEARRSAMPDRVATALSRLGERLFGRGSTGEGGNADTAAVPAKPTAPVPPAVAGRRTEAAVPMPIRACRDRDPSSLLRESGLDPPGHGPRGAGVEQLTIGSDPAAHRPGGAGATQLMATTHPLGLAVVAGAVGAAGPAALAHVARRPDRQGPS